MKNMFTIAKLLGRSPFAPLQTHMEKVALCMEKLEVLFSSIKEIEHKEVQEKAEEISKLEHEADLVKNDIRNNLPSSIFLPIDRSHFLEILSFQDGIADKAEDLAILLSFRVLEKEKTLQKNLKELFKKSSDVFWSSRQIISEIDDLLESSFGGIEAQKVKTMVEQTAYKEHEADKMRHHALKYLYTVGDTLPAPSFNLWLKIYEELGDLAALSEKLANRIRMVLELK